MTDPVNNSSAPAEAQTSSAPAETTNAAAPVEAEKSPVQLAREAELNDISDLLSMDIGGDADPETVDKNSQAKPGETPKPLVPTEVKTEEKTISPAPSPVAEEKPTGEAKPQSEELKTLLKDLVTEIKGEPAKPEPEAAKPEAPKYQPQIPDQIFAGLEHEDPAIRRQAMNAMIGGAMSKVYTDLKQEMQAHVQEAIGKVPNLVEASSQQKEALAKTRKDFYDENPEFEAKGPTMQRLVATLGIQLAQSKGADYKGFTKEFQVELAKEVEKLTGVKAGKPTAKPKALEVKPVKAANGFQAGASSARDDNAGTQSLGDEIADTIGLTLQ